MRANFLLVLNSVLSGTYSGLSNVFIKLCLQISGVTSLNGEAELSYVCICTYFVLICVTLTLNMAFLNRLFKFYE